MAQVIVEQGSQTVAVGGVFQMILKPVMFMLNYWYIFIIIILLSIAIGVIIYLLFSSSELSRERDEAGYFLYKKTIKDCHNNKDKKKYKKVYSKWNLLLLGIPLFWVDQSKNIYNKYNKSIGKYRGHVRSQDGTFNLLVCTSSILGLFDSNILIKIPEDIKYIESSLDEKTKKVVKKEKIQKFDLWKENEYDKTITIDCIGIERTAIFYSMPIIEAKGLGRNTVDLRQFVEGSVMDSTYQVMLQRVLNSGQKQMEKAMMLNPNLKYEQMSPQKTAPEGQIDKYGKE